MRVANDASRLNLMRPFGLFFFLRSRVAFLLESLRFFHVGLQIRGKLTAVGAEPLGADRAPKGVVGVGRKALGMAKKGNLPFGKDQKRCADEQVGQGMRQKQKGSAHHRVIPVVDAAARTAAVFQKPAADRAVKEDADRVADRISEEHEKEQCLVKDPRKAEDAKQSVEGDPDGGNRGDSF